LLPQIVDYGTVCWSFCLSDQPGVMNDFVAGLPRCDKNVRRRLSIAGNSINRI